MWNRERHQFLSSVIGPRGDGKPPTPDEEDPGYEFQGTTNLVCEIDFDKKYRGRKQGLFACTHWCERAYVCTCVCAYGRSSGQKDF